MYVLVVSLTPIVSCCLYESQKVCCLYESHFHFFSFLVSYLTILADETQLI